MTNLLAQAIASRLSEALAQLTLRAPDATPTYQAPQVFQEALPAKAAPEDPEPAPYVLVRSTGGYLRESEGLLRHTAYVSLTCVAYSAESEAAGAQDALNLTRWCLSALQQKPILDSRFERLSLNWSQPAEQTPPYYTAQVYTRWRFQEPPANLGPEMEVETYGSGY
jgi:hypothetical protein